MQQKITLLPNGTELSYFDSENGGEPIVLVHGFASNVNMNWIGPGWFQTLEDAGFRVIAADNRGHGDSTKYYLEASYSLSKMAEDIVGLLDMLNIQSANLMGYSMGARISCTITHQYPDRVKKLIIAGNGYNMVEHGFPSADIRDGLLAETAQTAPTAMGKSFRVFAEQTNSDLRALAACIMNGRGLLAESVFQEISQPCLVVIGSKDDVASGGDRLAALIPNAQYIEIPNRNHMNVVGDKLHKQAVVAFLA